MQKYQKMVAFRGRKIRLKRRHKGRDPFKSSSNFDLSIYSVYLQLLLLHITRTRTHPSLRVYVSMRAGEPHCSHTMEFSDIFCPQYTYTPTHIHVRVRKTTPTVWLEGSRDTR